MSNNMYSMGEQCSKCKVKGLKKVQTKDGKRYYYKWLGDEAYHSPDECNQIKERKITFLDAINSHNKKNPDIPEDVLSTDDSQAKLDDAKRNEPSEENIKVTTQLVDVISNMQDDIKFLKNRVVDLIKVIQDQNKFLEANVEGMSQIVKLAVPNSFETASGKKIIDDKKKTTKPNINKKIVDESKEKVHDELSDNVATVDEVETDDTEDVEDDMKDVFGEEDQVR